MDISKYRLTEPPTREDIIFEHGPADGRTYLVPTRIITIVVPALIDDYIGARIRFKQHPYRKTPRYSPDFRRIYTWVTQ